MTQDNVTPITDAKKKHEAKLNEAAGFAEIRPHEEEAALHFSTREGAGFKYDHTRKTWLEWRDHVWLEDKKNHADLAMRDMIREQIFDPSTPKTAVNKFGKAAFSRNALSAAQSMDVFATTADEYDAEHTVLNTPSGIVDLKTGEISPPDRERLMSKSTTTSPDPEMKMPVFKEFLKQTTGGDEKLAKYLQVYFGYCLTGLRTEEIFTFLLGEGGNGKGTLLFTVSSIMGDYAVAAGAGVFTVLPYKAAHESHIAALAGARLIVIPEAPPKSSWNIALVKDFTGSDTNTLKVKEVYQKAHDIEPIGKLCGPGNGKPNFEVVDEALHRRLRLLNFNHKPETADKELKTGKLPKEYPAILNWLIEGAVEYFKNGLHAPESIKSASNEYLREEDLPRQFYDDCIEEANGAAFFHRDTKPMIEAWRAHNGITRKLSSTAVNDFMTMSKRLKKKDRHDGEKVWNFAGIRMNDWAYQLLKEHRQEYAESNEPSGKENRPDFESPF